MRKIITYVLFILLTIGLTACDSSANNTSKLIPQSDSLKESKAVDPVKKSESDPIVVRVGDQPSFFLLKVAEEKGFFEDEFGDDNIQIEVIDFVNQGPAIVEAMAAGDIDLGIIGMLPIITANANNNKIIALASANYTEDGFSLIVTKGSGITSTDELRGKTIAAPFGTNEHQMLFGILKNADIPIEEVRITNMSASDSLNAFLTGDIDGAIFKAQQVQGALDAGGIQIADNSETGMIVNSLVGRETFIKEYPEITSRFLKVIDTAQKYIVENEEKAIQIAAEKTATDISDTTISFRSRDRLVSIDEAHFIQPLTNALEFAFQQELIDTELNIEDLIDTSYYKASGIKN